MNDPTASISDTTSCIKTYGGVGSDSTSSASSIPVPVYATADELAMVWNRPVKKIRKRMKRLLKRVAAGKKAGKTLEKFTVWLSKKGINPDLASNFDKSLGKSR